MGAPDNERSIHFIRSLFFTFILIISTNGCQPYSPVTQTVVPATMTILTATPASASTRAPAAVPTEAAAATRTPPAVEFPDVPYELISQESIFAYLQDLTSIQPYSGWRNSASRGEAEGLDYVESKLRDFTTLQSWGSEFERQRFKVFLSTELWESHLYLTVGGQEIEVPANGLRGSARFPQLARAMDSDGTLNDSEHDPLAASGPILVIHSGKTLYSLEPEQVVGHVLFLDFALIDTFVELEALDNGAKLIQLMDQGAAGLVLVTQFSNRPGESHGTLAGEGAIFQQISPNVHIPILHARLEDLAPAGIASWDDFEKIDSASLVLDSDVFSPGQAGNLVVRIPGIDSSRAVILGAHIDSPNTPGAFDDGSGSAALLEVARVLNVSQIRPAVDLYLAWFGGHEIGTYGSAHFASTHQELLDRSLAMLQIDCLGHTLDGKSSNIALNFNSYDRFGDDRLLWPNFLSRAAVSQGFTIDQVVEHGLIADNSNFDAFNLPNVNLIYLNPQELKFRGSTYIHYSLHLHDPYETIELAREMGDVMEDMTKIVLAAALETGRNDETLRISTRPVARALFVASHTESVGLTPSMLRDLGMAFAWEGLDVDLIPYGQALSQADLENVRAVILPPTLDYPGPHDETWSEEELALLEGYVAGGGLLVVTNSNYSYSNARRLEDSNEDARELNALLEPMGIRLMFGETGDDIVRTVVEHPLTFEARYLTQYSNNGVPISMNNGLVLARAGGRTVVGLMDYGDRGGQVLVIADLGILQGDDSSRNMKFIQNLAHFARRRQ